MTDFRKQNGAAKQGSISPVLGIIFDFDGLILDTEGAIFQSWQELYQEFGGELTIETWSKIIGTVSNEGDHFEDLETQIGRRLEHASLSPRRRQRELDLIAVEPVRPGVLDYLEQSRNLNLKIGLASSSTCKWVTEHLERLGLISYFDTIRARDDVRQVKPDPSLYKLVLDDLMLLPEQVIVLEDSPIGITAAKRAGLFCVAVPNPLTQNMPLSHADMILDSLDSMPLDELLKNVEPLLSDASDAVDKW